MLLTPYIFNILSDKFFLYSLPQFPKDTEEYIVSERNAFTVFLTPSLNCDFKISAYTVSKNPVSEYYAAAFCAAAFLIFKRGLPLDEISFETPNENIEIFNTGNGMMSAKLKKRKQLITNKTEILGCSVKYTDVDMGKIIRTAEIPLLENASADISINYLLASEPMPNAVVLYEEKDGFLKLRPENNHSKNKISSLFAFAAAAEANASSEDLKSEDGRVKYCSLNKRLYLIDYNLDL